MGLPEHGCLVSRCMLLDAMDLQARQALCQLRISHITILWNQRERQIPRYPDEILAPRQPTENSCQAIQRI